MKQFLVLALFTISSFTLTAQTTAADTTGAAAALNRDAQKMMDLFLNKDYPAYVNFIHPKIIKLAGGKDKLITAVKTSLDGMDGQGLTIQSVSLGAPAAIIVTKTDLQSVVTELLELKMQGGKVVATSYLIATSTNKGKNWVFSDTSGKTLKEMKTIFPTLSDKLVIPAKTKPVYTKD
jgi:hypothetical protein